LQGGRRLKLKGIDREILELEMLPAGAKLRRRTAVTVMAVIISATFCVRLWLEPKRILKK
jgi:hypothetical protein